MLSAVDHPKAALSDNLFDQEGSRKGSTEDAECVDEHARKSGISVEVYSSVTEL